MVSHSPRVLWRARMRSLILPTLAVLLLPDPGTEATVRYKAWQWQRVIEPASGAPANEQCAVLDADLYTAAAPGLRDVRLVQDGREIAYALAESYDEPALHAGPAGSNQTDRSLYTTVLRIPLMNVTPPKPAGTPSETIEQGAAVLLQRVPVERVEFTADAVKNTPLPLSRSRPLATIFFRLLATPNLHGIARTAQQQPTAGELIEDRLDADHPVERTAIGANLQGSARVLVTVQPGSRHYSGVLLEMHQRSICYQPLTSAPLMLFYGNGDARPKHYEYSSHYRPTSTPLLAHLGPAQRNPNYRSEPARAFVPTRLQRLSTAVCVAVAGFLLTAVLLLRSR